MAVTPLKVALFVAGAIVAAGGTAYVAGALDPYIDGTGPDVAALPGDGDSERGDRVGSDRPADDEEDAPAAGENAPDGSDSKEAAPEPSAPNEAAEAGADEADEPDVVVPTFDLVRVEPDGSLVVAGHAGAHAEVEIVRGADVIGATQTGPSGDFTVVLDEPLDPGDHQIVLRATSPDNVAATSVETAVVAIPDDESGQVLALVEQPGEPSRLITLPEAGLAAGEGASGSGGGEAVAMAEKPATDATGQESTADDATSTDDATTTDDATSGDAGSAAEAPEQAASDDAGEEGEAARSDTAGSDEDMAAAEPPTGEAEREPADVAEAGETEPSGQTIGQTAPATVAEDDDAATTAETATAETDEPPDGADGPAGEAGETRPAVADADNVAEAGSEEAGDEIAADAAEGEASESSRAGEPASREEEAGRRVFIEAVEIDGREVFVAGTAGPGSRLRVYANNILLGDTTASPNGRFLVEAVRDLPVGDYIVRADVLSDDGATVTARAAVPFRRGEGEQIAAVAPEARESGGETGDRASAKDGAASDASEDEAAAAEDRPTSGEQETDGDSGAAVEERADVVDGTGESPQETPESEMRTAETTEPGTTASDASEMTDPEARASAGESGQTEPAATDPEVASDVPDAAPETGEPMADVATEAREDEAAEEDGESRIAATEAPPEDGGDDVAGSSTATATAPALDPVDGAVIIRRGDTLWHISRRVYGRGIRYTTIYLANEGQIRDPHWIWPGQVFSVPEKTDEGVSADMKALGEQAVPAPDDR